MDKRTSNIIKSASTLILSIFGGILYRMGGAAGYNTKFRDFGIPTCMVALMLIFGQYTHPVDFILIICWGAVFGVQTTYWKRKGEDARWYNWLITGFFYSIAMLPLVVAQNWPGVVISGLHTHYIGLGLRTFVCTGLTVMWSEWADDAVIEENGRGFIEIVTLPLLFIG